MLRSLALKGRRFEAWAEIEPAGERATAYWNKHKHPFGVAAGVIARHAVLASLPRQTLNLFLITRKPQPV